MEEIDAKMWIKPFLAFVIFRAGNRRAPPAPRAIMGDKEGKNMVIAGEGYAAISLLMDTLCLTAAGRLCGLPLKPGRVLAGGCAGTAAAMAVLSCWGSRAGVFAALPIAALMALVTFGRRRCPRGMTALMLWGLLTGGAACYLNRLGLRVSAAALCCLPATVFALRQLLRETSRAGLRADVRLLLPRGGVTLDGLVDSGNLLRDPVTALPVVVASGAALAAHLPPGTDCLDPGTLPPGYRLILVRTAAGSRLMMCFRPRGLYIRRGRVWQAAEAVVAISGELEGARALLPASLMNGELGV